MDGVSGVLAVASFGFQLVQTIQKAKKFFKEIRQASEDFQRLVDALDRFESILTAANGIVERQSRIGGLAGAIHVIDSALLRCKSTVKKLDTSVYAIEAFFNVEGRGRKAWASLKTVARKDDIEKLRQQIHDDMMNLQTALLLNTSCLQLHHFEQTTFHSLPYTPLQSNSATPAGTIYKPPIMTSPAKKPAGRISRTQEADVWQYHGVFGKINLRRKTHFRLDQNLEEAYIQEETLFIMPSFLRTAFQLQYLGGIFQVPRSMTFCQIIPKTSEVWELCRPEMLGAFQQALSRREISPFARTEDGYTLLHWASIHRNAELCSLLLHLGVDANQKNEYEQQALHAALGYMDTHTELLRTLTAATIDLN